MDQKETELLTEEYCNELIKNLKLSGEVERSDQAQPSLLEKPSWYDEKLFKNAQSVYGRHFMGINFAHLSGLLLLIRVDSIYKTLSATGESNTVSLLFKRYYNTVKHVKKWYEGDIFQENSEAYRSLLMVRGMHNKVSSKFNDKVENSRNGEEKSTAPGNMNGSQRKVVHISEYDIMLTQFAFIGFIVTNPTKVGFLDDFNREDLQGLLHFWRIIGYYLGVRDKFNLCSYSTENILQLCNGIMKIEYKNSLIKNHLNTTHGIMSVNIVRSIKFIPMLTVYGIMRHLYEVLEHETQELESRQTWYSNLSYTFIKLVMTRLLSYKPLRIFNNGLTRLSLYLVGKIEGLYKSYLDSKYGLELKI